MGVTYRRCGGRCGGTYCTSGDYASCIVCGRGACTKCAYTYWSERRHVDEHIKRHECDGELEDGTFFVCQRCNRPRVSTQEMLHALIELHRNATKGDPSLTWRRLRDRLAYGRTSEFEKWRSSRRAFFVYPDDAAEESSGDAKEAPRSQAYRFFEEAERERNEARIDEEKSGAARAAADADAEGPGGYTSGADEYDESSEETPTESESDADSDGDDDGEGTESESDVDGDDVEDTGGVGTGGTSRAQAVSGKRPGGTPSAGSAKRSRTDALSPEI